MLHLVIEFLTVFIVSTGETRADYTSWSSFESIFGFFKEKLDEANAAPRHSK
jgi:hypothetical protein